MESIISADVARQMVRLYMQEGQSFQTVGDAFGHNRYLVRKVLYKWMTEEEAAEKRKQLERKKREFSEAHPVKRNVQNPKGMTRGKRHRVDVEGCTREHKKVIVGPVHIGYNIRYTLHSPNANESLLHFAVVQ